MLITQNLRITETHVLDTPKQIHAELPMTSLASQAVAIGRKQVEDVLDGRDRRRIAIVGPCSIHDSEAALVYADRLLEMRKRYEDRLVIIMRMYFEKPRTTVGWKGFINDPHLDGSNDIAQGIRRARQLLLEITEKGLFCATEFLDPIVPQYTADLVTWAAIGARTTESQTHREMASGLSMPVGFKNGTDGSLSAATNAIITASEAHSFLGIDPLGRVSVVKTTGNRTGHLVLRGGNKGPNYDAKSVADAANHMSRSGLKPRIVVDCSHGNSSKDYRRQAEVAAAVAEQVADGQSALIGIMIESNLVAGQQTFADKPRVFGQSITDACVDLDATESMLRTLATAAPRPIAAAS